MPDCHLPLATWQSKSNKRKQTKPKSAVVPETSPFFSYDRGAPKAEGEAKNESDVYLADDKSGR
jgi:hypothetical protein